MLTQNNNKTYNITKSKKKLIKIIMPLLQYCSNNFKRYLLTPTVINYCKRKNTENGVEFTVSDTICCV